MQRRNWSFLESKYIFTSKIWTLKIQCLKHFQDPKPYTFSYGVKDDYRGTIFNQDEQSDGKSVHGSYTVQLPDGRKQTVSSQIL